MVPTMFYQILKDRKSASGKQLKTLIYSLMILIWLVLMLLQLRRETNKSARQYAMFLVKVKTPK